MALPDEPAFSKRSDFHLPLDGAQITYQPSCISLLFFA